MTNDLEELLYEAAGQRIGLVVVSSNPMALRQKLYSTRKKLNDPTLGILQFRSSPWGSNELVICKSKIEVEKEKGNE